MWYHLLTVLLMSLTCQYYLQQQSTHYWSWLSQEQPFVGGHIVLLWICCSAIVLVTSTETNGLPEGG